MKTKEPKSIYRKKNSDSFLKSFSNIIGSIINKKDLDYILNIILINSTRFLKTSHGCIFLMNPTQEYFNIRLGIGDFKNMVGMKCNSDMGMANKIICSPKAVIINETCKWDSKRNQIIHKNNGKMIGIPIKTEEKVLGLFIISFPNLKRKFSAAELKYVNAFSSLALIALDNARLFNFIHDEYNDIVKVESSLRLSEDKFYKLFELSPALMAVISIMDHSLRDINENMLKVLKFKKSEIIGRKMEDFVSLKPEIKAKIIEIVMKRQIVKNIEVQIISKDGDESSGLLSSQIININGEDCMVFLVNDVTEINYLKEELEKSKNLESLAILSGGIAHNFNNLLQSLLGNISLAKYYLKPDDQVAKILTRAEKSYTRTKELTDQLIMFANGGLFQRNTIDIKQFLKKIIDDLSLPEYIKIKIDISDSIREIEGDERQLSCCIKNIIQNSIESMKENGLLEIKIQTKNTRSADLVNISLCKSVEIIIKDNGEGIKKENLRKILTPFFTTKGTTHKGLGLATSYSIINHHNGKLKIDSQYGEGTTVKLLFPEKQLV